MDGFLNWFFAFMTQMLGGLWKIISGIGIGFVQTFNVVKFYEIFKTYSKTFTIVDWIVSILTCLLVIAIWALIVYVIVLVIRKYIRFRKTMVGNEDVLQELADLHRDVVRLTNEKERIMALQMSGSSISTEAINEIFESFRQENEKDNDNQNLEPTVSQKLQKASIEEEKAANSGKRFYRLSAVDEKYEFYIEPAYRRDLSLEQLCEEYRNFCCYSMGLYYDIKTIRLMFAGLASTKLILLQGISGTGKTSMPYSMGKFFKNDATIASVQPSWRDRTELFGYFNEFTKKFNETEVLKRIYEASYNDDINIIVLDEMNIARVEYYFAEMLSVLEMPDPNEWSLELVPAAWPDDPKHLVDGRLKIPKNVWYIGTANNDDSTFSVSDKVYDRAFTINLDSKGIPFDAPETGPSEISYSYVEQLYNEAQENHPVSKEYLDNIATLDMYVIQHFRVAFGNRIMKQLNTFIPVYVACGGTELEGIDYMLATKVFRKFESLNLSLIRDEIKPFIDYLDKMFGKGTMTESIAYLERLRKMY